MNELRKSPIQYVAAFFVQAILASLIFYLFSDPSESSISQILVQPPYTASDWQSYFVLVLTVIALIAFGITVVWFTVTDKDSILLELQKARTLFRTLLVVQLVVAAVFFFSCWGGAVLQFGVTGLLDEHYLFLIVAALLLTVVYFFLCVKLMSSTNVKGTV
jgi:hypothetical protein